MIPFLLHAHTRYITYAYISIPGYRSVSRVYVYMLFTTHPKSTFKSSFNFFNNTVHIKTG